MTGQLRIHALRLAAVTLAMASAGSAIAAQYTIDILINPYHPGIVDSWLNDINDQGLSTGYIIQNPGTGPVRTAVTYRNGDVQVLPTRSSLDINNLGDIVGNNISFQPQFVGAGGSAVSIEVPGYNTSLFSRGCLNDSGNVLIQIFADDPLDAPPDAFSGLAMWNQSGAVALSALDPLYPYVNPPDPYNFDSGPSSSSYTANVTGLNNANQFAAGVRGSDYDPMDPENFEDDVFNDYYTHAYIYDGQGGYSFLEEPTPGEEIRPIEIDEAGTVLGSVGDQFALWSSDGSLQSVLPDSGTALNVLGFNGYPSVQRNSLGQIVAVTLDGGVMFYEPNSNAWTDITPSINGLGTGTFSSIQGFNTQGQFVGLVRPPQGGGVYGYVVSLVPEPSSLLICEIGLVFAACLRRRKISTVHRAVVRPHMIFAEDNAMLKRLTTVLAALAMFFGGIKESQAGPIDVSYTVSGTPGNYDLDFSVTNNMLTWPTQNVYFFAVRLSVDNIVGSPAPFFNNAPADANWFNYGGSATDYNNTWIASGPPFAPAFLLPGIAHSGFIVHIPDTVAPTAVLWSALSVSAGEIHPYTGGGNFINQANPGFEGLATPAVVPEPASFVLMTFLCAAMVVRRGNALQA